MEEVLAKVLGEEKKREQSEILSVLDALRKTRKARGGTGAPLEMPRHLQTAIVITDADLKD